MKWIGQHIYDLISRFRNKVYIEDDLEITGDLTVVSSSEGEPVLTLKTTHTTKTSSAELQFLKDAADTEDGENLGIITFYGENESNANTKFGHIKGSIVESDAGAEGGSIKLAVATHDGEMKNGLVINDGNAEDEIDVTIGDTATSLTTIAGTLTMGSTATINNSGVVQVAAQTVIDHDQLANFASNEHYTQANITTVGTIDTGVWNGTAINQTYLVGQSGTNTGDQTSVSGNAGTATTLATTRAINGVNFNGSAAIKIPTNRIWGTYIKLLPTDFMPNDDGGTSKGITLNDSGTTGMKPGISTMELVAIADIPAGFTATHVDIYDNSHDLVIKVYEMNIGASGMALKATGAANTTLALSSNSVESTVTNFLAIRVETTATSERVFGGRITIAPN